MDTASHTYNACDWRVYNSSGSLSYLLDPGGQLLGARWSGGGQNSFMWLGSRLLAGYTSGAYFAHVNVLGSETHMTDWAGNDAQAILYYPWGQVWSNPGGNSLLQVYASLTLYDTVNNGYVPPFRYYVSNQGRWLTPDPVAGDITNPQSLNRYAYVPNNPTSLTDPLGLQGEGSPPPCGKPGQPTCADYFGRGPQPPPQFQASMAGNPSTGVYDPSQLPFGPGGVFASLSPEIQAAEARYLSIITTGWDPVLGINWNNVPGPQDPGCGPGVVASINATIGAKSGVTFSQNGKGTEVGGNWDYTLTSNGMSNDAANALAYSINHAPGFGPGDRGGTAPSPHTHLATVLPGNAGTYVVQLGLTHNDFINPNIGLAGIVGHGLIDVIGGTLVQAVGGSLGCHN